MSGGAGPTETAVIVAVPEAEDVVGDQRRELDGSAAWGVPAHVTVLYPFVPPDRLDPGAVGRLRATVGSVAAFDCTFRRCGWFGEDVVWLAPEPAQPFRDLTMAVWSQFPESPAVPRGVSRPRPAPDGR